VHPFDSVILNPVQSNRSLYVPTPFNLESFEKKIRQLGFDKQYPGCSRSSSARSALCAKTPAPKNKSVAFTGMVVASFLNVLGCAAAAALAGVGTRRNVKQGAT